MASSFVPESLVVQNADDLKALYQALLDRKIDSVNDFNQLLLDVSDLDSFISEDMAWRYIRMTCDTLNKDHEESYLQFVQHIQPELAPFEDLLNQKLVEQPYWNTNDFDNALAIYYRSLKSAVDLFREANIRCKPNSVPWLKNILPRKAL